MDAEASSFETSEMLATFLASTPLLSESWRLCNTANTTKPLGFVMEQIGEVGYVAFSGIQTAGGSSDPSFENLVPLESGGNTLFSPLLRRRNEGKEPVMVHAGMLHLFLSMHSSQSFQNQMVALVEKSKSLIITGHSLGGTTASLCTLWLLSYLQSISSSSSVLCITYGSPLLGNESLSQAVFQERWGGNFCHVVSKHDIFPRLFFDPTVSLTQLHHLLQYWHLSMASGPNFGELAVQLPDEYKAELFRFVLVNLERVAQAGVEAMEGLFWPFGSYLLCSEDGAICVENAASVIKMMNYMLNSSSPSCSIEDHLKYGDYVEKLSLEFLTQKSFMQEDVPESTYEAGLDLALQSSGIANQESVARPAKDCLKMARRMGRTPNLNCANLAIKLSKINPFRAEIEWYKASCDASYDHMGYYDSFKQRGSSKKDFKVNMNRIKLGKFWDNVIEMFDNNELPHDFNKRAKWVNGSHSYKLLVEPLDIAEYYRTGKHRDNGHYFMHGRERRYDIFDRWWRERQTEVRSVEDNSKRSKFASLTQDSCFWAKVEEARDLLDKVRSEIGKIIQWSEINGLSSHIISRESDTKMLALLWENINAFEMYARKLEESKEVSLDVLAKNSSYCLWKEEWSELKPQLLQFLSL